jgi:hypothetical protein
MMGAELGYRYVDSPIIDSVPVGHRTPVPRLSADDLAGRPVAACLADDGAAVRT